MSWKLRLQVSAAGVHRPPVGGIAGTEKVGSFAYSLLRPIHPDGEPSGSGVLEPVLLVSTARNFELVYRKGQSSENFGMFEWKSLVIGSKIPTVFGKNLIYLK
jgi:hypothetical protein